MDEHLDKLEAILADDNRSVDPQAVAKAVVGLLRGFLHDVRRIADAQEVLASTVGE